MTSTLSDRMSRRAIGLALLLFVFAVCPAAVQAQGNQFGAPNIQRPTTSPYLNLFRGTNRSMSLGLNYQRRVRPEQDLRNYAARTNASVGNLQQQFDQAIGPDGSVILPGTGHVTSFMNTRQYFAGSQASGSYGGRPSTNRGGGQRMGLGNAQSTVGGSGQGFGGKVNQGFGGRTTGQLFGRSSAPSR